ncbi:MAG: DUF5602 domain-containing protein [Gemmatimonadales bacterium]
MRSQRAGAVPQTAAHVATAVLGVTLLACSGSPANTTPQSSTQYGSTVAVGNGTARSYLVTENGKPTELGVALSQGALDSLPATPKMGGYEYLVPLPATNPTQFQVIGLNWNPTGHPPAMIYTVPHFDVHFYMISLQEKNAIDPSDPAFGADAANLPAAPFRAANYVNDPPANVVPHMGLHWTDSTAAEFHGQPFTRTLINGSWNGQFTFIEPMVARAYLLTNPDDLIPVVPASQHSIAGYYPSAYRVSWNAANAEWRVALAQLQQ